MFLNASGRPGTLSRTRAMKNGGTPDLFGAQLRRSLDGGYLRFFTALLCYFIEGVLQLVPAVCLNILVKHFER